MRRWGLAIAVGALAILVVGLLCRDPRAHVATQARDWREPKTCQTCHATQFAVWQQTDHAAANRRVTPSQDDAAFLNGVTVTQGAWSLWPTRDAQGLALVSQHGLETPQHHALTMVIGRDPVAQYLSPQSDGRLQATTLALDSRDRTWFDLVATDGEWTSRELTWNNQCAYCHMTGFAKGYDAAADRYDSSWHQQGVSCNACHADMARHAASATLTDERAPKPWTPSAQPTATQRAATETCLRCHARREELTAEAFQPGDRLDDHYRLELPDRPGVYYPDGQVREEAFEGGSLLLSRMGGHGGLQCTDCHDPHSLTLRAPLADNALCLTCHSTGLRGAPVIAEPHNHSHHRAGSAGDRCDACHMPTTVFMQRDARRDHGFTSPDPQLTVELAIPNACNRCHVDRDAAWAATAAQSWYGKKLDNRQRRRARAMAALDGPALLALLASEEVPAWRATLVGLMTPWLAQPEVLAQVARLRADPQPMVRAAAARALAEHPKRLTLLQSLLQDPVRLVRVDAAYALRDELHSPQHPLNPTLRGEVVEWLDQSADTALGALRRADWALLEHDPTAVQHIERALRFAPEDAALLREAAALLRLAGQAARAAEVLQRAASLPQR